MKKIRFGLPLLVLCAALFLSGTARAAEHSGTWPDYELKPGYGGTWTLDGEGTLTFEGKGVIPPEEANGWAEWLPYRDEVKEIRIGSGVTELTYHVFAEFKNLQSVEIPDTVTAILDGAFRDCTSLTSVTIPASVETLSVAVEDDGGVHHGSFGGCTSLRTADVAAKAVGPRAFFHCSSLETVTLREGVASLGKEALYDCGLTSLTLPASLTAIEPGAVAKAPGLKGIETAAGNPAYRSVDGVVFSKDGTALVLYPSGREGAYDIPAGTESVAGSAFRECAGLTGLSVPEGLVSVGDYAFTKCEALPEAVLPASAETVGEYAFAGGPKLSRLELGGVESIGKRAFGACGALAAVTLPEGLRSAGAEAFFDCSKLTSVTIPGSLREVPASMFGSCFRLASVTLEDGVEQVGSSAFSNCRLQMVTIPRSVKQIGDGAFKVSSAATDARERTVYYAGTEAEWGQIGMGADPFTDPFRIVYESGGPEEPVLASAGLTVANDPTKDSLRLLLTLEMDNIGAAGDVAVCAAYYESGRMVGFREARLRVEPGKGTYHVDPLVFQGVTPGMVDSSRVFILDGGRAPLAKLV